MLGVGDVFLFALGANCVRSLSVVLLAFALHVDAPSFWLQYANRAL